MASSSCSLEFSVRVQYTFSVLETAPYTFTLKPKCSLKWSHISQCHLNGLIYHWHFLSLLPAELAQSAYLQAADIVYTHGPTFLFFTPQGRHFAPIKVKVARDHSLVTCGVESYSCKDRQCLFLTSLTQTRKFQLRNYVHVLGAPSIINCLQRPTLN